MKLSLAIVGIITCSVAMGQNVTLAAGDWQEHGIVLLPASSPQFSTLLSALAPATQSDPSPVSTYSFILQNLTLKTVVAFGVRWTCVDADGRSRTRDLAWSNLANSLGSSTIASGAERAITPILNLKASLESRAFDKELAYFTGQRNITVTLEAVVLSDGTALGADANNTIPRLQAQVDAERAVLSGVTAAWQQAGASAMSDYLQQLIGAAPPPNGPLAVTHSVSASAAYSAALSDLQTEFARHYLRTATSDPAILANFAQQKLAKASLNIHR